jgi:hypothetical protein
MPTVVGAFQWEVLVAPLPGVREPTDAHWIGESKGTLTAVLARGQGQGQSALTASNLAVAVLRTHATDPPTGLMARAHGRLADTVGASALIARIRASEERLDFCGVGRLRAVLVAPRGGALELVSGPGVLGIGRAVAPRGAVFPWTRDSLLVLASDGVVDHWDLSRARAFARAPLAEVVRGLIEPFGRVPDDVSLVVIRES